MLIPFLSKKTHLWLLSLLSGVLLALSWPVNGFAPLIFLALVPLFFISDFIKTQTNLFSRGAAVLYSFPAFFIFNIATTYWVYYSTAVGSLLAFFLNSLFMALVFGLSQMVIQTSRKPMPLVFTFGSFWLAFEYLHMNWDLSWSWLNLGNVFSENPSWVQWYEYTGVLGGSLWIIIVNAALYKLLKQLLMKQNPVIKSINLLFWLAVPLVFSYVIQSKVVNSSTQSIKVLCLQPNVEPYTEAYVLSSERLMHNMLDLVRTYGDSTVELIVTPESSIERGMLESNLWLHEAMDSLRVFLIKNPNYSVIMGASTRRILDPEEKVLPHARPINNGRNEFYYNYNTALHIAPNLEVNTYHKARLVPGVERMPFNTLMKPFEKYAIDLGGTTGSLGTDPQAKAFEVKAGIFAAPIICYESIYGEYVTQFLRGRKGIIAIITNDAWWYDSPGHRQHFSYARLRAIENRRYLVRSANTGISGIIDAKGEVVERTEFYTRTAVKAEVPILDKVTFYSQAGDYLGRIAVFVASLFLIITISMRLRKVKEAKEIR